MFAKRFISLRWKLLLTLVGLVLSIVAVVLFGVSYQVQHRIVADIEQNFVEKGRIFERMQQIRFRQLRQTAILLADVPTLKAAIATGDTPTINHHIRNDLLFLLDFDPTLPDSAVAESFYANPDSAGLVLICNYEGFPIGQLASTPMPAHSIAERAGIRQALDGEYPRQTYLWESMGRYFHVMTVPIWLGDTVQGTLSYGYPIRQEEADQLAADLQLDVAYFVDDHIVANSFDGLNAPDERRLASEIHGAAFEIGRSGEATTVSIPLADEQWMVYVTPMQMTGEGRTIPGYYAIARSYTQAIEPLRRLQLYIFVLGVLAVLTAVVISFMLTNRITRPVDELVLGIGELERGNYHYQVPVVTNDELGLLTRTYNGLVSNLRERLEMLKFVSGATLDAIKKNLSSIQLGGERKEVAIFFSDIRGFTSWSENRPPEQVIDMLNTCLRIQGDIIQRHDGDIDKYVGDELVAVFEGPNRDRNAVRAAIDIQQTLARVEALQDYGITVGVGINSGTVVMGAMGSESRMDYTVIGNHVNLGARLCTAAGPGQILVSEWVTANIDRKIPIEALTPIRVKGIEQPVQVYEVLWQVRAHESIA